MTIDQDDLTETIGRPDLEVARLRRDIEIIAESLRDEAMNRDWCSEYGDWIERVNMRTSEVHLLHCSVTEERVYQVTVTVTGRTGGYVNDSWATVHGQLQNALDDLELDGVTEVGTVINVINL